MILVINTCKEKLHYYEFVKPVEDILENNKISFFSRHYKDLKKVDFENASKIIICGTSLKDNSFVEDINYFKWVYSFDKPLLSICAGMQIIGLIFGGKMKKKTEIGYYFENFNESFLGLYKKQEVWHLHNNYVDFKKLKKFELICQGEKISQAVKHREKEIYGVLFHPEVRQKELIKNFAAK